MRRALMVLLALGAIGGFGAGFASLGHRSCHRRADFERHVARICAEAALEARDGNAVSENPPPPHGHRDHCDHWQR